MSSLISNAPCFILCICSLLIYFTSIPASCLNNDTDFESLMAFKNAIDADPQGALTSWNETVHFCSWPGVYCGRKHPDRVVAIDLMSSGLVGTISPHLGNLSFLNAFTVQNNSFYGPIPEEIGRLRRLEYAVFSNNSFSGEIPRNLSNCVNIYYLDLIQNNLTGSIPELSSLVRLQSLGLSINQLSGIIPPYFGNFSGLIQLSLRECGLQGEIPESFAQLKSLVLFNVAVNNLTGRIPSGLYNISTMRFFDVRHNQLEGTIPSQMGFPLSALQILGLGGNRFSGQIPSSLSNFSALQQIYLGSNSFSGPLTIDFNRMSTLSYFSAEFNSLEGDLSFISTMINCTRLKSLEVRGNLFSGLLPNSIANISNELNFLGLSENRLGGSIPLGIGNLQSLARLYLFGNDLSGPVPSDIGKLSKLRELWLQQNRLSGVIPPIFNNLTILTQLNLGQNNFTGEIPLSLSNCTNLLALSFENNFLSGSIPPQVFMNLPSILIFLNLGENALTGSIPPEFGLLANLVDLSLSNNRLSGNLPDSLRGCVALQHIYLQSNSFSGEIPAGLGDVRNMQYLDLSQNNLSGAIPEFLGGLESLTYLNLSFNNLEGEVPTAGVFLNQTGVSLDGNDGLCGGIPSLSFPPCPTTKISKKSHFPRVFIILIPVLGTVALVAICCYTFLYTTRKRRGTKSSVVSLETDHLRLSYGDLLKSTGAFSELNLLGAGRFGSVYKGDLENPQTSVAVKVLNLDVSGAAKSLMAECSALRGMRHRNLVKIMSVCSSTDFNGNDFKALVYQYMVNGDLDKWLHRSSEDETRTLNLRQRVNIAIDIAAGLEYLHGGTDSTVVHGDLKPSNILLDEDMIAHVSDFGLAKVISDILSTNESTSIGVRGTIGYIPPEYGLSSIVSTEGDVYSYGILLLEMFTGKRPTNDEPNDSPSLRDFVKRALQSRSMDVVDPRILQEHSHTLNDETMNWIASVMEIGLACSNELPRDRMLMKDVVIGLRKAANVAQ